MVRQLFLMIVLAFWSILLLGAQEVGKRSVSLIPYPVSVAEGEGIFVFSNRTVVALDDKDMMPVVKDFLRLFVESAGFAPKLKVDSKKGDICIWKDESIKEEGYALDINPERITIKASDVKGAFYALQTLRQLLPPAIERGVKNEGMVWAVPAVSITDEPRFSYRGLMVDVARYFIPKEHLLRIIDTMGMLKLNKLHLHLTDDNGWRLEIKKYPLLTEVG